LYGLGTFILVLEWKSYGLGQHNSEKPSAITPVVLAFLPFVISVLLAGFVNKFAGRKYLRNGWEFFEPDAEATKIGIQRWGIIPASADALLAKSNRFSYNIRQISIIGSSALCSFILVLLIVVVGDISSGQKRLLGHQGAEAPTRTTDYGALCVKLQGQFAAGGAIDAVPPIPTDVIVENGVGRVVAAPARCLADLAKKHGIGQISIAFNVVGGDASTLREIRDNAGNRRPITDFPTASIKQQVVNQGHAVLMEEEAGGTYVVPVRINGAITLNFVVDTGASDVLLPVDVVLTLTRAGTIAEGDYVGDEAYQLADGSTIKSDRFVLRQLEVGDQVLINVPASIGDVHGVPLLGQSFLNQFISWTIDNDRHVLLLGPQRRGPPSTN
jgi:clan AA aspartic protease (TIGR02281 family)